MSGYRCVNFNDLCRLCSSAGNNNVQIFNDEILQKKITECLPIVLNEKDRLPKVVCCQCLEYVSIFSEFRQSCSKAQKMLESCLNSSKLRNGGQVYIKDEIPTKKVLKPVQNPSPTKLIPNLCNIVTSTPTKQVKKNILSSPNQPDFLSSIMQAVGIQTNDEALDNTISFSQNIQPQPVQNAPQYTLTLDGGTLKSGQIQYKIENTGNLNLQTQTQVIAKNAHDTQTQGMSVNEFLKLNTKKKAAAQAEEPKNKKPKFNLILQASPQKPKIGAQVTVSSASKTFGSPSSLNTPVKPQIQIHNIEKILPSVTQSQAKQLVVPIMMRNDNTKNLEAVQLISQALTMSTSQTAIENKPQQNHPFMFMKIQPNADGQLTLTSASSVQSPQPIQLSLSPQQIQQLSFQAPLQHQQAPLAVQPQITVTQISSQEQTDSQTQTTAPSATKSEVNDDDDDDSYENIYEDDFAAGDSNGEESQEKTVTQTPAPKTYLIKKATRPLFKPIRKIKEESLTELQSVHQDYSDQAKKQLNYLISLNTKKAESEYAEKIGEINLTVCEICKKVFKRKEFLMQHLKSHIGLRPFKCDDLSCNKSFSRKEHLLRHVVSHTGKKMFNCDVCMKLFSRKDNLNKHRRIHPQSGNQSIRHFCPNCNKGFTHRAALAKHQMICSEKSEPGEVKTSNSMKEQETKTPPKKVKIKTEKKTPEVAVKPAAAPPAQPQIVTIIQQPSQQQIKAKTEQQQIILSMSQAQAMLQQHQSKGAVYTFPTNLILNANGAFVTNSGEVVGNFKFENQ